MQEDLGIRLSPLFIGDVNGDGHADWAQPYLKGNPAIDGVWLLSGRDRQLLHDLRPDLPSGEVLASVARVGDVDGDGHADILGGFYNSPVAYPDGGAVYLWSGKTGRKSYRISGRKAGDLMGTLVAGIGDVDQDGAGDFMIRTTEAALLVSGKARQVLTTFPWSWTNGAFGPAGDIDRDGVPDLVFNPRQYVNDFYSGRTRALIRTWTQPIGWPTIPKPVGDLDGDGWLDLVLWDHSYSQATLPACGIAYAVSTKDFSVIRRWVGTRAGGYLGYDCAAAGDVDGDGHADVVVGEPGRLTLGNVQIFSGRTGGLIRRIDPSIFEFGLGVDGGYDVNADGTPDVIGFSVNVDVTQVWTHLDLALRADVHLISVPKGGQQQLGVAAGPASAARWYLILGTHSDVKPGIQLGSLHLPLNPDPYLALTLQTPNAHIVPSLGLLDAQGRASATLTLPPLPTSLIGTRLDHAYVVFDASPLRFVLASNSVSLLLGK